MVSLEECPPVQNVIGFPVNPLPFNDQVALMLKWAKYGFSKVVCIANVHMLVEAHRDPCFASVLKEADLVTPDGMPLVWMLRRLGASRQDRVAGPDVLVALCRLASLEGVSLFFLGSQSAVLERIRIRLKQEFPELKVAGMEPLPFRPSTEAEDEAIVQMLNESGAGIVLVSLGCPKQELWMAQHKDKVRMVMIGVGGAFPMYAGIHKRAPRFIQQTGLEWLYRLMQEPRRLWRRYSSTIPIFIWLALKQLMMPRQAGKPDKKFSVQRLR
jgi:N-acetylglucosaminyldiphosphoundecaprenol N-acetyl-beta-D-mannosaminyltransferase